MFILFDYKNGFITRVETSRFNVENRKSLLVEFILILTETMLFYCTTSPNRRLDAVLMTEKTKNEKIKRPCKRSVYKVFWRRRRDSNPRCAINTYTSSSRAP